MIIITNNNKIIIIQTKIVRTLSLAELETRETCFHESM